MDNLPAQLEYMVKQLKDKKNPTHIRQNYYSSLVTIRDNLTKTLSEFMIEYEGSAKNNKKDKR